MTKSETPLFTYNVIERTINITKSCKKKKKIVKENFNTKKITDFFSEKGSLSLLFIFIYLFQPKKRINFLYSFYSDSFITTKSNETKALVHLIKAKNNFLNNLNENVIENKIVKNEGFLSLILSNQLLFIFFIFVKFLVILFIYCCFFLNINKILYSL